jgi:hypothetical protein
LAAGLKTFLERERGDSVKTLFDIAAQATSNLAYDLRRRATFRYPGSDTSDTSSQYFCKHYAGQTTATVHKHHGRYLLQTRRPLHHMCDVTGMQVAY